MSNDGVLHVKEEAVVLDFVFNFRWKGGGEIFVFVCGVGEGVYMDEKDLRKARISLTALLRNE